MKRIAPMKLKAKKAYKKIEKKAKSVIEIWRFVVAIIIFLLLAPLFAVGYHNATFYPVMIAITVLLIGLVTIFLRSFRNKKISDYLRKARILLLAAGLLVAVVGFMTLPDFMEWVLLLFAAFLYSLAAQRLGLGIFIGAGI